jgi:hypothetical protein
MNLQNLVQRMQGGGFNSPRTRIPSPFPGQRIVQPTLDDRDRYLLETVQRLKTLRNRKRMTEDVKFQNMVSMD